MAGTQTGSRQHPVHFSPAFDVSPHDAPAGAAGLPTLDDIRHSLGEVRTLLESADHVIAEYIQIQRMASVEYLARELGHDLRNSLMALAGKIYQMERELPYDEVRRKAEDMRGILKNIEDMVKRLHSLGSDEQSEEGAIPLEISHEAGKVIRLLRSSLGESIQIRLEACHEPFLVLLCRGDIWRILSNLLLNARDAMPAGGKLQVRIADRHVDASYCQNHGNSSPGHFAVLSVIDSGTGIPPETLPRIFDPLFTTKSPSLDGQKRGWGLAIVYTLVRRRGGWIDVESQTGNGTRFEVFLPIFESRTNVKRIQARTAQGAAGSPACASAAHGATRLDRQT